MTSIEIKQQKKDNDSPMQEKIDSLI